MANNYKLQADSPCIDAGVDVGLSQDFDGTVFHGIPDIGAFERIGAEPPPPEIEEYPIVHVRVIIDKLVYEATITRPVKRWERCGDE